MESNWPNVSFATNCNCILQRFVKCRCKWPTCRGFHFSLCWLNTVRKNNLSVQPPPHNSNLAGVRFFRNWCWWLWWDLPCLLGRGRYLKDTQLGLRKIWEREKNIYIYIQYIVTLLLRCFLLLSIVSLYINASAIKFIGVEIAEVSNCPFCSIVKSDWIHKNHE